MEHWFDDLTRGLARKPRTRRSALGWAARLGIAAAGVGFFGRQTSDVQAEGLPVAPDVRASVAVQSVAGAPASSSCSVEDTYGVLLSRSVTTVTGVIPMTLTHSFTAEVASGITGSTLTVVPGVINGATPRGDATLRMTVVTSAARAATADVNFGALYTGTTPRRSSFSTDGQTVQGVVDGKATAPAQLGAGSGAIRFPDGKPVTDSVTAPANPTPTPSPSPSPTPQRGVRAGQDESGIVPGSPTPAPQGSGNEQTITPPTGTLTPATAVIVQRAIAGLLQQAQRDVSSCTSPSTRSAVVGRCTDCQMTCRAAWVQCSLSATQASLSSGLLAGSAYLATASATCDRALQQCFSTCKGSGACCPSHCNGDAACCQSAWGCCAPGKAKTSSKWSAAWPTCPRCGVPS